MKETSSRSNINILQSPNPVQDVVKGAVIVASLSDFPSQCIKRVDYFQGRLPEDQTTVQNNESNKEKEKPKKEGFLSDLLKKFQWGEKR